jgi:hypothetical protein
MRQETIAERAAAIRLSPAYLSRATGKTAHAIGRILNCRTSPFLATVEALERVIVEEELRLRDYLNTIHPPAGDGVR